MSDHERPDPPWWPVLTATVSRGWVRHGDAWAQIAVLAVTVVVSRGLSQDMVAAAAVILTWILGTLPGARPARTVALGMLSAVSAAVMAGHPTPGAMTAWALTIAGLGVGSYAPHPDDVTPAPNPWEAARVAEASRVRTAVVADPAQLTPDGPPATLIAHGYPAGRGGADAATVQIARLPEAAP